jgi:iron complex outermembrane receptor protein
MLLKAYINNSSRLVTVRTSQKEGAAMSVQNILANFADFARLVRQPAVSSLALGVALVVSAGAAQAQDATSNPVTGDEPTATDPGSPQGGENEQNSESQEIVVTGFRASLRSAVVEKKRADSIVESVSAEDIGKLPDASIAESIARLPGLTSQRLSGRSQVITIRGFSPDFSTTLLNGREQVSTGDNRSVEYDQYPSEIVNQVMVYKTPTASLIGQGLSGTVDLRTVRPLQFGKRVISVGARGEYADLGKLNAGSKDKGFRVNGTWIQQFGDTLGVALAAAYTDSPYQIEEFNAWGYPNADPSNVVIGGSKSFVTSTRLKRLGLIGTVEFEPTDNFHMTVDAYFSDFKDLSIKRGIELPLYWSAAQLQPGYATSDGMVESGTFTGVKGVLRNDRTDRKSKTYALGWNGEYEFGNGFSAMADASWNRVKRDELVLESYSGTGRGPSGATDTIAFEMTGQGARFTPGLNYSDPNLIFLTSPQGWGGNQINPNGPDIIGGQDGYYNNRNVEDELKQFRAELEKEFDGGFLKSLRAGINYTTRDKRLTPDEFFLGLAANTDGMTSVPIPADVLLRPTNLSYLGLGPVVSYDPLDLLEAGVYNLVPNAYQDVVTKAWKVSEDVLTPYVQANFDTQVGSSQLTGNVGVQVVSTDQSSSGVAARYAGQNPDGSPIVSQVPVEGGAKYTEVLPSLNMSMRMPSDFVVRFGLARQLARARMDDLRVSQQFNFTQLSPTLGIFGGDGGNPELKPWLARATDLTFEKYFGTRAYVAAQFFHKKLENFVYTAQVPFDFSGYPVPTNFEGTIDPDSVITRPINGKGGKLYGVELAGTLPFEVFASALEGFGLTGGLSYTKSKIRPSPNEKASDLPGYSRWVANGTAYFERAGFSARASVRHRSSFIGEISGFGALRTRRRAAPETIIDAQLGYEFQPGSAIQGLSIYLQGQNLTDEPFVTFNPAAKDQIIDYQSYGRRYLLGASYKF